MSTILLADDSLHAQRMGERILLEEGFDVVTAADSEQALERIASSDPDLILADVFLPGRGGFELCRYVKTRHRYMRVILIAGLLERFDEAEAHRAGCDAILRKPFEASRVMETVRPLVREAQLARGLFAEALAQAAPAPVSDAHPSLPSFEAPPPPDPERVRAAVTAALETALPALVREITEKVLVALGH